MPRQLVFILCALFLVACQSTTTTTDFSAIYTSSAATAFFMGTEVASIATLTPEPSNPPTATSEPTASNTLIVRETPRPTQLPTITPTKVAGVLQQKLSVEPLAAFNRHAIKKITGWNSSFKNFMWMGVNHLLLDAVIEKELHPEHNDGIVTHPVIVNLASGKIWIPELAEDVLRERSFGRYDLPHWSEKLQKIILEKGNRQDNAGEIYTLDGTLEQSYPGTLLGVSPSGTKLLFYDGTWIDLLNGKTVKFDWDPKYIAYYSDRPVWSVDEIHVFVCCSVYGNTKTGESYSYDGGSELLSDGEWVSNNTYLVARAPTFEISSSSPPLFDLSTRSFGSVSELAGITDRCDAWDIAPSKKHIWITCSQGSYLVDLISFKSWAYPEYTLSSSDYNIYWSSDGKFARIGYYYAESKFLSVETKKFLQKPEDCLPDWPPVGNVLLCKSTTDIMFLNARTMSVQKIVRPEKPCHIVRNYYDMALCLSEDKKTLLFVNIGAMTVQNKIDLPFEISSTHRKSPDGNHLALLAQDGSLWLIDYPSLKNLEQLTPATTSQIGQISWSPDSRFLAFLGDTDIYIVDTRAAP